MLNRLIPARADNAFEGRRAALWILGLYVALKLVMSLNSIFNTESVAVGADGFRLNDYGPGGARAVLMLFALTALGQLALAVVAVGALVRYRALVPLIYLLLIGEHITRRLIVNSYAVARSDGGSVGSFINYGLLALLVVGLVMSLVRARPRTASPES